MITAQSPAAQIRRELEQDEPRAHYWMEKQHHGERGYEKWRSELCRKLWLSNERELFSEPVEYQSRNGNRWLAYEHTSRDGQGGCYSFCYAVCYRETVGSVEAIVRCNTRDIATGDVTVPGCIIFTGHFFQRFAERLGLELGSKKMMLRFLQLAHHHIIREVEPRPGCRDTDIIMRYPASFAFGSRRDVDGFRVVTVRTFLPATMLSPKKRKELQEFGVLSDEVGPQLAQQWKEQQAVTRMEYVPAPPELMHLPRLFKP